METLDREGFWDSEETQGRGGAPGVPPIMDLPTAIRPPLYQRRQRHLSGITTSLAALEDTEAEALLPSSPEGLRRILERRQLFAEALVRYAIAYKACVNEEKPQ